MRTWGVKGGGGEAAHFQVDRTDGAREGGGGGMERGVKEKGERRIIEREKKGKGGKAGQDSTEKKLAIEQKFSFVASPRVPPVANSTWSLNRRRCNSNDPVFNLPN